MALSAYGKCQFSIQKIFNMTTRKDPIRQASLYTMNGLIDPRLLPGYSKEEIIANDLEPHSTVKPSFTLKLLTHLENIKAMVRLRQIFGAWKN